MSVPMPARGPIGAARAATDVGVWVVQVAESGAVLLYATGPLAKAGAERASGSPARSSWHPAPATHPSYADGALPGSVELLCSPGLGRAVRAEVALLPIRTRVLDRIDGLV